jgi:hypothetical protein
MGFEPTTFCMASLPPVRVFDGFRLGEAVFAVSARRRIPADSGSFWWVWAWHPYRGSAQSGADMDGVSSDIAYARSPAAWRASA